MLNRIRLAFKLRDFWQKNCGRDFVGAVIIRTNEFAEQVFVVAEAFCAKKAVLREFTKPDGQNRKAHQLSFTRKSCVIAVIAGKGFHHVLILHNRKRFESVAKTCGFLKIQVFGGIFHLAFDFLSRLLALVLKKFADFFDKLVIGLFVDFVQARRFALPDVIIHTRRAFSHCFAAA